MGNNNRITQRDRNIVKFVEDNKSITITQCKKLFMSDARQGYNIAQRRLNKLADTGYLKVGITDSNENVYYISKQLSYHDLLINDFYVELLKIGATNITPVRPMVWESVKIKSDAIFIYDYQGFTWFNILEVAYTHKYIPLVDYEKIYKVGEIDRISGNLKLMPIIVIMDDEQHEDGHYYSPIFKTVQLNFNLDDMAKIFIV